MFGQRRSRALKAERGVEDARRSQSGNRADRFTVLAVGRECRRSDHLSSEARRLTQAYRTDLRLNLGCAGWPATPVMPSALPGQLRAAFSCRLFVRPSIPSYGTSGADTSQADDLTEDGKFVLGPAPQVERYRELHAKVIAICGRQGSALYVGSSNCTRRGLGSSQADGTRGGTPMGGGTDLSGEQTPPILGQTAPRVHRLSNRGATRQDNGHWEPNMGRIFLPRRSLERCSSGQNPGCFQETEDIPADLLILMPDAMISDRHFLLVRTKPGEVLPKTVELSLNNCVYVNEKLETVAGGTFNRTSENVSTWVEVRWSGQSASFPVRFDEKSSLPRVPGAVGLP